MILFKTKSLWLYKFKNVRIEFQNQFSLERQNHVPSGVSIPELYPIPAGYVLIVTCETDIYHRTVSFFICCIDFT